MLIPLILICSENGKQLKQSSTSLIMTPRRHNHTWLRIMESDFRPLNIGASYVWKKVYSQEHWHSDVNTAMLK